MRSLLAVAILVLPVLAALRGRNVNLDTSSILIGHIRANSEPDVVAHLLAKVEHNWIKDRLAAFNGETTRSLALSSMIASCSKVVYSIASSRIVSDAIAPQVKEYMTRICAASKASPNDEMMCRKFGDSIHNSMMSGFGFNRWSTDLPHVCTSFFDGAVTEGAKALQEQEKQQGHGEPEQQQEAEEDANQTEADWAQAAANAEVQAKATAELDERIRDDEIEREFASFRAAKAHWNDENVDKDPELGMWNDEDDTDDITTTPLAAFV